MKISIISFLLFLLTYQIEAKIKVLIFSKTTVFRHESIKVGKLAIINLCNQNKIEADTSENSSVFELSNLKKYNAIIFLSTTGDILNDSQQNAFEKYIQSGGGFVGIHAASDTEYEWSWFCSLVGGNFNGHPHIQNADLLVVNSKHPSTKMLPKVWKRKDEWYNFKNLYSKTQKLIFIDKKSYEGSEMPGNHALSWFHEFDGGKSFYTALGHTNESYSEPLFLKHILGGIKYVSKK